MPLRTRKEPTRARQSGLIAAAAPIKLDDDKTRAAWRSRTQSWQEEAWGYYDDVGEIKFAMILVGNWARKIRLFAAVQPDPDQPPIPVDAPDSGVDPALAARAIEELDRLRGDEGTHGELMASMLVNFSIPGECILLGEEATVDADEQWRIYSTDELKPDSSGTWAIHGTPGQTTGRPIGENATAIRLWRQHPRFSELADSNMRGVLDRCDELLILGKFIRGSARSRLNNGVWLIPEEIDLGAIDPTRENAEGEDGETAFIEDLIKALSEPIHDEGAASQVVPVAIRVPSQYLELMSKGHVTFARPIDDQMAAQRNECIDRIAAGLDLPAEVLLGLGAGHVNHWCVSSDTEILTAERGWTTHETLEPGDIVLTLNHDTGLSEWQPVGQVARFEVDDLEMVSIEQRLHSSLTTVNHRWPILDQITNETNRTLGWDREWLTSETLTDHQRIITGAPSGDLPTEAKWADAFVELVGWFFTEGTCRWGPRNRSPQVLIGQSHTANPDKVARIRRCLTTLYGPATEGNMPRKGFPHGSDPTPRWREFTEDRGMTLFSLNRAAAAPLLETAPDKLVPAEFVRALTAAQLELFIQTAIDGDGTTRGGSRSIIQRNPKMLEAVELAAILAGYSTSIYCQENRGGFKPAPMWNLTVHKRAPRLRPSNIQRERYTGTVWCPTTPNRSWLARRGGNPFFTGNTSETIDEQTFKAHLQPNVELGCGALTKGFLAPALRDDNIDGPRIFVWYDESNLVGHPNPEDTAFKAHDVFAISDAALRQRLGFSDTDAPSANEIAARVIRKATVRLTDPGADPTKIVDPAAVEGDSTAAVVAAIGRDVTPRAITAGATPVSALGGRLGAIDRELTIRLRDAASFTLDRALETAGARLRSRAQGHATLATRIKGVPPLLVPSTLGVQALKTLGTSQDEILAGSILPFEARYQTLVQRAQDRTRVQLAGLDDDQFDTDTFEQQQTDHRAAGWVVLSTGLIALAGARMFDPHPEAPPVGEHDTSMNVPSGLVREALARAGGALGAATGGGMIREPSGAVAGGVATGTDVLLTLASLDVHVAGYTWTVGDPDRPFEPHQALDGVSFSAWDDDVLLNTESFPDTDYYAVGDHDGCLCGFDLELTEGASN